MKGDSKVERWWPKFEFDTKNAMKSKLTINLKNCQYDLFKIIAMEELGWRVIDNRGQVLDPESVLTDR
jgi:hypothetical protein